MKKHSRVGGLVDHEHREGQWLCANHHGSFGCGDGQVEIQGRVDVLGVVSFGKVVQDWVVVAHESKWPKVGCQGREGKCGGCGGGGCVGDVGWGTGCCGSSVGVHGCYCGCYGGSSGCSCGGGGLRVSYMFVVL